MENSSDYTSAQMTAAVLNGTGKLEGKAPLAHFTGRVPFWQLSQIEAMAQKAQKSRNSMLALVLEAGIEAIRSHLDEKTLGELRMLEGEATNELPATVKAAEAEEAF